MLFRKSIPAKKFLAALRNLGITLKAGIPLVQSLKLLEHTEGKNSFVSYLRLNVEKGMTLGSAMENAPWNFPPIAVSLIKAGELSGTLQENLEQIVHYLRKSLELQRKIKGAMIYPTIIIIAVGVMGLILGTFVLPQLIPLFESLDVELPVSTKALLWMSLFFRDWGFIFSPAAIFAGACVYWTLKMRALRPTIDRIILHTPLLGTIQKQSSVSHICSTMSILLKSGLPIVEALPATTQATTNAVFRKAMAGILPSLQEGHTLAQGLRQNKKLFPEMMITLIEVGETAGNLSDTLEFIANYHEEEVDYAVKNLSVTMEPALLVFIGIIVGMFVHAIITPIYNVTSSI
jgi:type IV pilus assembly protein PilC